MLAVCVYSWMPSCLLCVCFDGGHHACCLCVLMDAIMLTVCMYSWRPSCLLCVLFLLYDQNNSLIFIDSVPEHHLFIDSDTEFHLLNDSDTELHLLNDSDTENHLSLTQTQTYDSDFDTFHHRATCRVSQTHQEASTPFGDVCLKACCAL